MRSFLVNILHLTLFIVYSTALSAQSAGDVALQTLVSQGNVLSTADSILLLPSAHEKYADMFRRIREAQRYVNLEYFIFRNDSVGAELLDILSQKASEGVEIRLLIDAFGNYKSPNPFTEDDLQNLFKRGIKVAIFDPLRFPWIPNMLHRDHRKIVVVDGLYAYTGGMNIAEYYLKGTNRTGPWRDVQICFSGPVVAEFDNIFTRIWQRTTGESVGHLSSIAPQISALSSHPVVLVNREPHALSRQMRRAYAATIDAAQREIRIVNPYPTNVRIVRRAMYRALRRGVRLQLMVSSNMDNRVTPEVVAIQMKKMAKRGADVYYYDQGFHHSKLLTVDDEFCSVGTANLDGRSMSYDYEVSAFIFDKELTREINDLFCRDTLQCHRLTPDNFRQHFSLRRRFIGRIFQPLKNLL